MISIIIPVYNERRYLRDCVLSAHNQDIDDFEIILVDDGSNNGAEEDCDNLQKELKDRVRVIHKSNAGLSAARITGVENAKGDWILFMDHDDILSPYALNDFLKYTNRPDIDIIAGGRINLKNPETYVWNNEREHDLIIKVGTDIVEDIPNDRDQKIISIPLWGKLYRSEFLRGCDLTKYRTICPTIFFEDVLMTPIIYSKARNICIIKNCYYIHREVMDSISRSGKLSSFYYEQIYSGDLLLQYTKKHKLYSYYDYQLGIYMTSILRIYCLIDNYLKPEESRIYKDKIIENYNKYCSAFKRSNKTTFKDKVCAFLFGISPSLLMRLSRFYYER